MKIKSVTIEFDDGDDRTMGLVRLMATLAGVDYTEPGETAGAEQNPSNPLSTANSDASETRQRRHRRTRAEMEAAEAAARNPSGAGEATAGTSASTEAAPPATESRRRRVVPPPAPDPMPINDAELSKAASDAAAALVALGEDGPGIVMLVLNGPDGFGVEAVGEVKQEDRKRFIAELQEEVKLAREDHAGQA